jgi:hypothetical protein
MRRSLVLAIMIAMLTGLALFFLLRPGDSSLTHRQDLLSRINLLAETRDMEDLLTVSAPELRETQPNPFHFLRTGGAYGTGRFGWKAEELKAVDGKRFIVFTTLLTSQDIGDQVFEWDGERILRKVDELDPLGVRIVRQDIKVRFEPEKKTAHLENKVSFRRTDPKSEAFIIRMSPQYRISRIIGDDGKTVEFAQAGGVTSLPATAETFAYTMAYSAVVDAPGYAGSITDNEVQLTNDYWYPMIARMAVPYSIEATVPAAWTVVAQGEEAKPSEAAGDQRVHRYRMDMPAVYYSFSAGIYRSETTEIRVRTYTTWSTSLSSAEMRLQNELNAPIIEFYERIFGRYPFSRWGALDTKIYGGGAIEAYSHATYGVGWLPDEDTHEPAHTWWGGIIPNTYLKSLWNESFTVFSEGLYAREGGLGNINERRLAFIRDAEPANAYRAAPLVASGAPIGPAASSLGYGKGAHVLQALELELGTDRMIETMQRWLRSHPRGETAEWEDYERVVGEEYRWFFDQWLRQPGWPIFDISNVRWQDGRLTGQAQFEGHPYRLTLEVLVEDGQGRGSLHRVVLRPGADGAADFELPLDAKPSLVSFDPWRKILRNIHENERPTELRNVLVGTGRYTDPKRADWLPGYPSRARTLDRLPENLDGVFVVGHPDSLPVLRPLCAQVGFIVSGDRLTYDGTMIDLNDGGALAVVDLPGGGRCVIGLGKTVLPPNVGRARLAITDGYGRFLRGVSEPKRSGRLTFRL